MLLRMDLFKKCINFKNHHFFIFSIAFTLLNEIKDTGKQNIQIGQGAVGGCSRLYCSTPSACHLPSGSHLQRSAICEALRYFQYSFFCFHLIGVDCFTSVFIDGMPWTRPVLNGLKSWKNYQECGVNRQVKYNVLHNQVLNVE